MTTNYRYISGDSHLEIDSKHWINRVPAKYRDQAPRLASPATGGDLWMIGDKIQRPAAAADLYGGKGREQYIPLRAATKARRAPAVLSSEIGRASCRERVCQYV